MQEVGGLVAMEVADAGPEVQDALGPVRERGALQPLAPVVVGAQQAVAGDVLEVGDARQRALQLALRQVERVVVDGLGPVLKGLQQEADLAQVAGRRAKRARQSARHHAHGTHTRSDDD